MKMRRPLLLSLLLIGMLLVVVPLSAQEATAEPTPIRVELQTADGVTLVGDLYNAELNVQTPAVLLLPMLGGKRGDWLPLIPALTAEGYRVLAVDLRGQGESGGSQNWQAAVGDVQEWINWMRAQPAILSDRIAVVGASIGSNLALIGCANDSQCQTAVALSPGKSFMGVAPGDALTDGYTDRAALLIASRSDSYGSGRDVQAMVALGKGEIGMQLYPGVAHGTALLASQPDTVIPLIVNWLDTHL